MIASEYLRSVLDYDPETGTFKWRASGKGRRADLVAGHAADERGYLRIKIKFDGRCKNYRCHRLAWLYVYGEWPSSEIDHINEDKSDNRIANLRIATRSQNVLRSAAKSKSGFKGVYPMGKRWQAQIRVNDALKCLGTFDTVEEAANAVTTAHRSVWGAFSRGA